MANQEYIKISNRGEVDLTIACNIIGGSTKKENKTIGMFGSGLKYALAQAYRQNIEIVMAIGKNNIYHLSIYEEQFRDIKFEKLCFINNENIVYKTPISIDYGQYDWTDKWFIYREILSNALDEKDHTISLADTIANNENETSFFLKYDDFREIYDNQSEYFCDNKDEWVKAGSGNIYKNGVLVGKIDGINLDWQNNSILISESRQVERYNALFQLGFQLSKCNSVDTICQLIVSEKKEDIRIDFTKDENAQNALKDAFHKIYGEYAIAPDDEVIKKDLENIGINPVSIPEKWKIDMRVFPSYKKKINPRSSQIRQPNEKEYDMIKWGIESAKALDMKAEGLSFFIINKNFKFSGQQDYDTMYLREDIFVDKKKFLITFLHEIGHFESHANDYDRAFADYFIEKIVDFIL
jgi:hypothetical protein